MMMDAVALSLIRDVPHPSTPDEPPVRPVKYVRRLLPMLRDESQVRRALIARVLYTLTLIASPVNLLFGRDAGLTEAQLAMLVFMPIMGQIVSGVLWAQVCRQLSYPVMMAMAEALGALTSLANIACFFIAKAGLPVLIPLSVAMVLISVNTAAGTGFYQQMIADVSEDKRSDATVLGALVMAPLSFGTYLAGAIVEHWGYLPVYLIMLVSGTVGWILVRRHIPVTAK
jgi:hypothetical protein